MVKCQNIWGKHSIFSFFLLFCGNKQHDSMSSSQHLIIIQSDQDLCPLTKLMKYISRQEQSRKDLDKTVRMHRSILAFAI